MLKKPCPKSVNDIDLTEEIKEYVLTNRKWHHPPPPKQPPQTQTQVINNTIFFNNYIASIDCEEKLDTYMKFNNKEIICVEDKIEQKYQQRSSKLENNEFKISYELGREDFLDIIDDISLVKDNRL